MNTSATLCRPLDVVPKLAPRPWERPICRCLGARYLCLAHREYLDARLRGEPGRRPLLYDEITRDERAQARARPRRARRRSRPAKK